MPTLILPGGAEQSIPAPATGTMSIRDVRNSLGLKQDYRLLVRGPDGKLVQAKEDDLVDPDETLEAVPHSVMG